MGRRPWHLAAGGCPRKVVGAILACPVVNGGWQGLTSEVKGVVGPGADAHKRGCMTYRLRMCVGKDGIFGGM